MRNIGLILMASAIAASAFWGCTTTSDQTQPAGGGGATAYPPYEPPTTGVGMNEYEACVTLTDALSQEATRLRCVYTSPTCPAYIRGSGAPECSQYDEGSIEGCKAFYGTYTTCDDFELRPCQIHNIEKSEPKGCPADAGAPDAADTDAADTDVATEASDPETGGDATSEPDGGAGEDGSTAD